MTLKYLAFLFHRKVCNPVVHAIVYCALSGRILLCFIVIHYFVRFIQTAEVCPHFFVPGGLLATLLLYFTKCLDFVQAPLLLFGMNLHVPKLLIRAQDAPIHYIAVLICDNLLRHHQSIALLEQALFRCRLAYNLGGIASRFSHKHCPHLA